MSRVHDALRRAEQSGATTARRHSAADGSRPAAPRGVATRALRLRRRCRAESCLDRNFWRESDRSPFSPSPDSHLIDMSKPHEAPAEEFRTLRTRLNHLQTLQPIHTVVVTSPSPAEGKSFAAVNLALAEAQLEGNPTLLVDCDFRRPIVHNLFQVERSPGLTDYLTGKAKLEDCVKRIGNTNLYILPAGEAVINPLELLNLREMKTLHRPASARVQLGDPGQSSAAVRCGCESACRPLFRNGSGRAHRNHDDRLGHARDAVALREQCARNHRERRAPRRTVLEVHVLSQLLLREARRTRSGHNAKRRRHNSRPPANL